MIPKIHNKKTWYLFLIYSQNNIGLLSCNNIIIVMIDRNILIHPLKDRSVKQRNLYTSNPPIKLPANVPTNNRGNIC